MAPASDPRRPFRRCAFRTLPILLSALAPAAFAQISGSVRDPSGAPIPGVALEAWDGARRVDSGTSGPDGAFHLQMAMPGARIVAHRIGFETVTAASESGVPVHLRLAPAPLLMEPVHVRGRERAVCPNRETPEARATWERARRRYAAPAPLPEAVLEAESFESTVDREEIGDVTGLRPYSRRVTSREMTAVGSGGLISGAYARRVTVGGREHWEYAPLAWGLNGHFVTASFGEAHTLALEPRATGSVVLSFCPRGRGAPTIEGTLTLDPEGSLRSARWRYRVPRSRSEAGGEAEYLPPEATSSRLLLPRRSLFWRSWLGRYHFREDRYLRWEIVDASGRA